MSNREKLPSKFDSPDQSPGYQLWLVTNRWQRAMRKALAPCGLTHVQFVLLAVTAKLSESRHSLNQAQIADAAATDKMMTSQVVRTLEEKGLMSRTPDPNDARAFLLSLTAEGRALIGRAIHAVEDADALFFDSLGDDTPALAGLLNRLASDPE